MNNIKMKEKIEGHIRERLPPEEEDKLWIEFLKEPEWYAYFITFFNLIDLARKGKRL